MAAIFKHEIINVGGAAPPLVPPQVEITPTLVIGLGGTGKEVVMRLRRMFYERYGVTKFPMIAHLVIDSDNPDNDIAGVAKGGDMHAELQLSVHSSPPEFINCELGQRGYDRYFFPEPTIRSYPHIFSWITPEMSHLGANAVISGCGMQRPFGRLCFFHHYRTIRQAIENHIRQIISEADQYPNGAGKWAPVGTNATTISSRFEVIVVHSIAGGTGAGLFIDVNFLVRQIIDEFVRGRVGVTAHLCDIAVLPGMLRSKLEKQPVKWQKMRANGYASLMEMEHYSMRRWDRYSFLNGTNGINVQADARGKDLFHAVWDPAGSERDKPNVAGPPWHTCYLIDNENTSFKGTLEPEDVFEMIAEYLMLDFEPTAFGATKRTIRSNATANLNRDYAEHVPNPAEPIFSNIYSCGFGTFGLAQIYCDRDRLRRAMAYRLAYRIIMRQLGKPMDESAATSRAQLHFEQGLNAGRHQNVRFTKDYLIGEVLRTANGGNLLDVFRQDFNKLRQSSDQSAASLEQVIALQKRRLVSQRSDGTGGGEATMSMVAQANRLRSALTERLDDLAEMTFQEEGIEATLTLLNAYRVRLDAVMQQLKAAADQKPADEKVVLSRLLEVDQLWHMKKVARHIEFARAVDAARDRHVAILYDARAAQCALSALSFALDQLTNGLKPWYEMIRKAHKDLADSLLVKFNECKHTVVAARNYALLTLSKDEEFDAELKKNLPKRGTHGDLANQVDFARIEAEMYGNLRKEASFAKYQNRVDASRQQFPGPDTPQATVINKYATALGQATYSQVAGIGGGLNAIDKLLDPKFSNDELQLALEQLRKRSDPYLPRDLIDLADFDIEQQRLLGWSNPDPQKSETMLKMTRNKGIDVKESIPGEPDSLVLFQELSGLPLCLLRSLKEMAAAYDQEDPAKCHLNFRDTKLYMPDIEQVNRDIYRAVNDSAPDVLLAIMFGVIAIGQEDKVFYLNERIGTRNKQTPLASRLDRTIKEVCKDPERLQKVRDVRSKFLLNSHKNDADLQARKQVTTLIGLQLLLEVTKDAIKIQNSTATLANPIYYSARFIHDELQHRLQSTPAGQRYLSRYDYFNDTHDPAAIDEQRALCFRAAHPEFPIPVHNDQYVPSLDAEPASQSQVS